MFTLICDHCSTETRSIDPIRLASETMTHLIDVLLLRELTKSSATLPRRPSNISESWTNQYCASLFHLANLHGMIRGSPRCQLQYTHLLGIYIIQGKNSTRRVPGCISCDMRFTCFTTPTTTGSSSESNGGNGN